MSSSHPVKGQIDQTKTDEKGSSVFVDGNDPSKKTGALKKSVFMNLGPQGSAEYGEEIKVPMKRVQDDGGDVRVGEVKEVKAYSVKMTALPSGQNEKNQANEPIQSADDSSGGLIQAQSTIPEPSPHSQLDKKTKERSEGSAKYEKSVKVPSKKGPNHGEEIKAETKVKTAKGYSVKRGQSEANESMSKWASKRLEECKKQIGDMSAVGEKEDIPKEIWDIYLWIAACLVCAFATGLIGTFILKSMVATPVAIAVAAVTLPLATHYFIRAVDDDERRMNLFYAAGVYGLFIGIIAKSRYTTFRAPPSFVIPLSIAFCAKNLDASYGKQARLSLLVMSIAPAMAVYVVYGFISNSMEFAYIMWMVVMALATVADLHSKLGVVRESRFVIVFEQIQSVVALMLVDLVLTVLLQSSVPSSSQSSAPSERAASEYEEYF